MAFNWFISLATCNYNKVLSIDQFLTFTFKIFHEVNCAQDQQACCFAGPFKYKTSIRSTSERPSGHASFILQALLAGRPGRILTLSQRRCERTVRIQTGINYKPPNTSMFSLFKDVYMSSYTSKYGDKIKRGDFLSGWKMITIMCGGRALCSTSTSGAVISSLLKTPPLPDSDSAGHVGCIDGRGRVFRSDDITAPRSKCCKVLFRHTLYLSFLSA